MSRPVAIPERPLWTHVIVANGMQASLVILSDLIAIGSLRWLARLDDTGDYDAGHIGLVYVAPNYRRQGVATLPGQIAEANSLW